MRWLRHGSLRPEDLVWHPTLPQWMPAAQIPGLFPAQPLSVAPIAPVSYRTPPKGRPSWLWPVLIPVIALLMAGAGLGVYFGAIRGDDGTTASDQTTSTGEGNTTSTEAPVDLGKAEALDGDPNLVVYTEEYGAGPADQVLVMMAQGNGRAEAEAVAAQISGTIVGEVEYIQLYQIQTSGTTAQDLRAAIQAAAALPEVESAFANGIIVAAAAIEGAKCSPLRDPLYNGINAIPYEMIGLQQAWDLIKTSGVGLNKVHVGMVDTAVYTKSGQGFGTELNFPDANGVYPEGQAQVSGLSAADATDQPDANAQGGLSHGTRVAHVMVAGAENGGVVGILGPAGDKVTMTTSKVVDAGPSMYLAPNPDPNDVTQYQGFFIKALVELKKQVDAGATVINLSVGSGAVGPQNADRAAAYKRFFEQMQRDKPKVVFVAAAGNYGGALDGTNYAPGGMNLPNLITVGALDQTGDRATAADWYSPEQLAAWYEQSKTAGTIPAGQTLEQYTNSLLTGSNYATGQGEVTISACGTGVPAGLDTEGRPVLSNGTSFATPQVAAAAALLKTINPELTADDIKRILVESADADVTQADGTKVTVPAGVGGKVLRVDKAVLKVINQMLPADKQLKLEDLLELATVHLAADGGPDEYTVTASVTKVGPAGTDLTISMTGQGTITDTASQHLSAPAQVSWTVTLADDSSTIKVHRSDTKTCAVLTITKPKLAGTYTGSFVTPGGQDYSVIITVDAGGNVESTAHAAGQFLDAAGYTVQHEWTYSVTGTVAEDGKLAAQGTLTVFMTGPGTSVYTAELVGQITDGTFTGEFVSHITEEQRWPVTATVD